MDFVTDFTPWVDDLLGGVWITVLVTVLGAAGALVISFVFGLLAQAKGRLPRFVARTFIEFFRGTSLLVQLWWLFFVLPAFGWTLEPLAVGVTAFALNFGAYGAEVVRGAINAVPRAQWEATVACNMTAYQRMRLVILPQAVVGMIPPFNNLLIQLLKSTPLVYTVTLIDVTAVTQDFRAAEGHEAYIFGLALLVYLALAYLLTLGTRALERRAKAAVGQHEPARRRWWSPARPTRGVTG
ncbi:MULTISPECIES: ectoine/hydroxyectoine ABC transporter permease subunit EhuC [Micromonospora]|uniref:Amino acid ABC transporter membrane protein 1, PAAT family (TC 3.A.1.3.-) n=1 Tax=Micromonospora yangpuensis TaxID=683228 RepID=A0A1C6V7J2_9ACTN|nr:ectoine/hydroxyectoine ABC transporter permease subunit EhuC [Micromonospora yangpuensis]GGM28859.1 ectoine/hydroxyectoine ABC transporter permease subunit EhuC [Micromonospora yangpuensis]SCL62322.1 amino acid ABC transporter membrane protein 1, PAAT family (TC 3.A.1.3.-) [Micromonospora yangpuensis]